MEVIIVFGLLKCFFDNDDEEVTDVSLGRLVSATFGLGFIFEVTIRRLVDFDALGVVVDDVVVVEVVVGFGSLSCFFDNDDDEVTTVSLGRLFAAARFCF